MFTKDGLTSLFQQNIIPRLWPLKTTEGLLDGRQKVWATTRKQSNLNEKFWKRDSRLLEFILYNSKRGNAMNALWNVFEQTDSREGQ